MRYGGVRLITPLSIFLFVSSGLFVNAQAPTDLGSPTETLSPAALFSRCYRTISSTELAPNNPQLLQVINGTLSPVDACMVYLNSARIVPGNPEPTQARAAIVQNTPEALAVFSTLASFFRSWFELNYLDETIVNGLYSSWHGFRQWTDMNEESLHLLRALLDPSMAGQFKKIVTSKENIIGIREHPSRDETDTCRYLSQSCYSGLPEYGNHQGVRTTAGTGILTGIRIFPDNHDDFYSRNGSVVPKPLKLSLYHGVQGGNLYLNGSNDLPHLPRSYGGGLIGTRGMLSRYSQYHNPSNGGHFAKRRWAKAILEGLMCRTLPALRVTDVESMVNEYNAIDPPAHGGPKVPFRTATSCMKCHAAMDGIAATARGMLTRVSSNGGGDNPPGSIDGPGFFTPFLAPAERPQETVPLHMTGNDSEFFRRPPKGQLIYRSYNGTLVNQTISPTGSDPWLAANGIQNLGQLLSDSNDLYVCTASRLIEFFTGVKVNLSDPGDPSNPPLTDQDLVYRAWAEQLAIAPNVGLKTHQNLQQTVRHIIESPIYQSIGFRGGAQ